MFFLSCLAVCVGAIISLGAENMNWTTGRWCDAEGRSRSRFTAGPSAMLRAQNRVALFNAQTYTQHRSDWEKKKMNYSIKLSISINSFRFSHRRFVARSFRLLLIWILKSIRKSSHSADDVDSRWISNLFQLFLMPKKINVKGKRVKRSLSWEK